MINSQDNINPYSNKVRSAVKRLTLVNFRNYNFLDVSLDKNFIVLFGENGSGKTNILEAISFLSQGRGLRNAKLSEIQTFNFSTQNAKENPFGSNTKWSVAALVTKNDDEYHIGTTVETHTREISYNEIKEVERRTIKIDGEKIISQGELSNYLSLVWVTPQMDRLFLDTPQIRRSFLDRIVCSFDIDHSKRISAFDNLYRQWSQVLKTERFNDQWLKSIEEKMASLAISISAARKEQIDNLNYFIERNPDDYFPDVYLSLDGSIENMLDDRPAIYVEDFYLEHLLKLRNCILNNNNSTSLPRTDLQVIYKKKNTPAAMCSTGEQKSLLLSIILSQTRNINAIFGTPPILLLDEIAAHLDEKKRDILLAKIKELHTQTWLTATDRNEFSYIKDFSHFFEIKNNELTECG